MLQGNKGGASGVLLVVISTLSMTIPTSAMLMEEGDGSDVGECVAILCISEVMPNPDGTDSDPWPAGEWVELIAMSNIADLSGWKLIDTSGRSADIDGYVFTDTNDSIENILTIEQGGVVLFSASSVSSWSMKNTNGGIFLRDPDGNDVDEANWVTQQSGISIIRMNTTSGPWTESTVPTPGLNGGRFLTSERCVGTVCINEVMIDPEGTDGRGWPDGEWIELKRLEGERVDWNEWRILHKEESHELEDMIVTNLSNDSVVLLDWGGNDNTSALTNTQDMIALLNMHMDAVHILQWDGVVEGESMIYGEEGWRMGPVPTPGIIDLEPDDVGRTSKIFFSRLMPGQSAGMSGEWWEIESREEEDIQLFGWKLRFTRPSGGVEEGVISTSIIIRGGERLAFGTNPSQLLIRGGPDSISLDQVMKSAPSLTDGGGMLELFDPQGRLIDVVAYGDVLPSSDGWIGGPIPTPSTSTQGLIWLRGDGCRNATDTNSSDDWMLEWRKLGGSVFCEPIQVEGGVDVTPMISPGPEALVQLIEWLDGATTSIDVQMYELMSVHIAQALLRAELRGVDVTLLLEDSPLDETVDLEMMHGYAQFLSQSGVDVRLIGSDDEINAQSPYRYLHAKIAVRDGSSIWIGSGNWKDSSFPIGDAQGNRERGVFVHHTEFATEVLERMKYDANISLPHVRKWSEDDGSFKAVDGWIMPNADPLPPEQSVSFPPTIQVERAKLLTCPDECVEGIVKLIEEAEHSLDISVQGLSLKWESEWGVNPIIEAIELAAERGVRVRLLHNGYYMNDDVRAVIQRFNIEWNETLGHDTSAILMNVDPSIQKLHDKTLLIDNEVTVLGSLNFAPSAFLRNREHMIVLNSDDLTEWFGRIFEEDWFRFDNITDTDGDGLTDGWEESNGFNRFRKNSTGGPDQESDQDDDGLDAMDEQRWGGDPYNADTDGDCIRDDIEVMWAFREGVLAKLAVSTIDANNDGILDNATVTCDGELIIEQEIGDNVNETNENVSLENITDFEAVDEGEEVIGISILLIGGVMFLLLTVAIGVSLIRGSNDE